MIQPSAHVECGDSRELIRALPDCSVDSVVCDPPYFLNFMGRDWDKLDGNAAACSDFWREVLRVLKPGGHLLAFGAPRTYHRLAVAVEDAGFEIRDSLHWVFGTGFPKSLNVSKALDKAAGAEREDLGPHPNWREGKRDNGQSMGSVPNEARITAPATDAAKQWDGYGTALKPSHEPVIVARKPLTGTVAANVMEHGVGALNVDGCRVPCNDKTPFPVGATSAESVFGGGSGRYAGRPRPDDTNIAGRWPPNLLLTHSPDCAEAACADDCPVAEMGRQSGTKTGKRAKRGAGMGYHGASGTDAVGRGHSDTGTAARYFPCFRYQAKASKRERSAGLDDRNEHPTVKPIGLMRWLIRLVTPPGGLVLDPFTGSGSTGCAAALEGVRFLGFEQDAGHAETARQRIAHHHEKAA